MYLITEFKRCRCCQETLPASAFHFHKQSLELYAYCKPCTRKKNQASKEAHNWESNTPEWKAGWYQRNKDHVKAKSILWHAQNKEYCKQYKRGKAAEIQAWYKAKYDNDPAFKIVRCLRARVRHALAGRIKSDKTVELLGSSIEALKEHLEKQFRPGMSWDNHGPVWEIDHIRPCADFSDLSDPAQQRECFHYTNLQPLFMSENRTKGAVYLPSSRN